MFQFTRAARRENVRLNQLIRSLGTQYEVVPGELSLIALLRETSGVAARAFDELGVNRKRLCQELLSAVPPPRPFDVADASKRGMVSAEFQHLTQRCPYYGTAYALHDALRDPDGTIARLLAGHGVTIRQILEKADQLADADGTLEGGTVPAHGNRSYAQWLKLVQTDNPAQRLDASLKVMSQTLFLTDEKKAEYADTVIPVMKRLLTDRSSHVRPVRSGE